MQTLKIKYIVSNDDDKNLIKDYQCQYSKLLRWMYNRVCDGFTEKKREQKSKQLNNINLLDSWFIRSASKEAQWIYDSNKGKKVVFGGKNNFIKRCKGLISKDEYNDKRIQPLFSIGEGLQKGNRKFKIFSNLDFIFFRPNKNYQIKLTFCGLGKNYKNIIEKLFLFQETKSLAITYHLSQDYIFITFDEKELYVFDKLKKLKNRVMAIDLNPNYIGWSIVDWKSSNNFSIVKHGVYSLKQLNEKEAILNSPNFYIGTDRKKYYTSKRHHEVMEISKNLINKAIYYQCEMFSIEELTIETNDKKKGKKYNRLINSYWCRDKLVQNIEKRCNIFGIQLLKVKPDFSSFIGNVVFRPLKLADMVLSSIEIGRRAYEFKKQYIDKIEKQRKNIIFPSEGDFKEFITQSLEELGIDSVFDSLKDLYYFLKKSKFRYRLSLENVNHPVFSRCFSQRSLILKYVK